MARDYLVEAANEMVEALNIKSVEGRVDQSSLKSYLLIGCSTLQRLAKDDRLNKIVSSTSFDEARKAIRSEYVENIKEFIEKFITVDRRWMLDAGMNERMVNYIFKDATRIMTLLFETNDAISLSHFSVRVQELASSVCREAQDLKDCQRQTAIAVNVIASAAVAGVNGSVDSGAGAGGWISAASTGFASYVLTKFLPEQRPRRELRLNGPRR